MAEKRQCSPSGGKDTATSGEVWIDGKNIVKYSSRQLTSYRRDDIGFVFQFYNLIPNLTALENVELALQICKDPLDAEMVLKEVGLADRMKNFPAQLPVGSSRGYRLRVHWQRTRSFFCVMSRQGRWITIPVRQY